MLSELLTLTDTALHSVVNGQQVHDHVADLNVEGEECTTEESCKVNSESNTSNTSSEQITSSYSPTQPKIAIINDDVAKRKQFSKDLIKDDVTVIDINYQEAPALPMKHNNKPLFQGQNSSSFSTSESSVINSNDVIAEKFKCGARHRIFAEKIKPKQNQLRNHKRIYHPTVIKENAPSTKQQPTSVEQVTSAAVAPFVTIQNALEHQITSLVSTLQNAHVAEKDFITKTEQVRQRKEVEMLDRLNEVYKELNDIKNTKCCQNGASNDKLTSGQKIHLSYDNQNDSSFIQSINRYRNVYPVSRPTQGNRDICKEARSPVRSSKQSDSYISVRKDKQKAKNKILGKDSISQVALLQTPVPRRKAPQPFARSTKQTKGSECVELNKQTSPRMSHKGLALLHEIINDNSTPSENVNNDDVPPRSHPMPTSSRNLVARILNEAITLVESDVTIMVSPVQPMQWFHLEFV